MVVKWLGPRNEDNKIDFIDAQWMTKISFWIWKILTEGINNQTI